MSITLGLAENYAMLGNTYLGMKNAGTVKGFMGSNFLSYPPNSGINSNGIELDSGSIPNAPIVNGAAAKQAIADVNTAISQYQAVTPAYPPITGPINLNTIITAGPGRYTISGGLTTNGPVTLTGLATDIYVFNVTGYITITNDITLTGGLLPQNVIFIASNYIEIYNSTVSGIYISTGNSAYIEDVTLTGRLISTDTINDGSSANSNSTVTAPQFA